MNIEYIYDEKGKKKGVIIPIELWEELIKNRIANRRKDMKKYRGIIDEKEIEIRVKKLRDEWERI